MIRAEKVALYGVLFRAAAAVGDFWVQTDYCAQVKRATDESPVRYPDDLTGEVKSHGTGDGQRACAWHCVTYTGTQGAFLYLGSRLVGIRPRKRALAAALLFSGVTHYVADRRVPNGILERVANRTGKGDFYRLADHGINGALHLDQAWHHGMETLAAFIGAWE